MLVPPEDLRELTDRRTAAGQIEWLRERGWTFQVSAAGRPKVDVEEYRRHMIGGVTAKAPAKSNLSWIRDGSKKTA